MAPPPKSNFLSPGSSIPISSANEPGVPGAFFAALTQAWSIATGSFDAKTPR